MDSDIFWDIFRPCLGANCFQQLAWWGVPIPQPRESGHIEASKRPRSAEHRLWSKNSMHHHLTESTESRETTFFNIFHQVPAFSRAFSKAFSVAICGNVPLKLWSIKVASASYLISWDLLRAGHTLSGSPLLVADRLSVTGTSTQQWLARTDVFFDGVWFADL